ncbi:MAG: HDOD domain-containing protein [Bacillota bacterium]|nr:HDOD domain-containing protein [Bacillota bacterium]
MGKMCLDDIVDAVNDLPALPNVVIKVLELTEDPNSTAQDINQALSQDQGMMAKVLRLSNSAFYGFPRRIATITDATIFLGFRTVRGIVMAASVSDILSQEVEGYALAPGELWKHSQAVAMGSRLIARNTKYPNPDVAYTAGLLHDIGKVILNTHMKDAYHEVVDKVVQGNVPFYEAEDEVIGFNHAIVGARIAEKWNLPDELVHTIAWHHLPEKDEQNNRLTSIVHLADVSALSMGIGIGIDGMLYPVSKYALQILNMEASDIEGTIARMVDLLSDQQSF